MKRRTLLGAMGSAGCVLGLTGCVQLPERVSADPPKRPVVPGQGRVQEIQDHYSAVNAKAWAAQDAKLEATVEGGPLLATSTARMKFLHKFTIKPDKLKSSWGRTTAYLPAAGAYPRRFLASYDIAGPQGKPHGGRDLTVYERLDAAAPWKAMISLEVLTKKMPIIAQHAGLAEEVPADARGYVVQPGRVAAALATALERPTSDQAKLFADSGDLKAEWQWLAKVKADNKDSDSAVDTDVRPDAYSFSIKTTGHGCLVLAGYSVRLTQRGFNGATYSFTDRAAPVTKKYPGHYQAITQDYRCFTACHVPATGKISVLRIRSATVDVLVAE